MFLTHWRREMLTIVSMDDSVCVILQRTHFQAAGQLEILGIHGKAYRKDLRACGFWFVGCFFSPC